MKILIVDDNLENIDMMSILLKSQNYDVQSASNGREALEKLRSGKYDLIISDILMPVMDGFQLCRECKKDSQLRNIYFIFYTATYIDKKDEELALALGAQKFIRKPQEPEVFLGIIKESIKKPKNAEIAPILYTEQNEKEIFRLYNERLVNKLEKKNQDLLSEITAHKKTESKLKESEERFRSLIEQASEGIILADDKGIIIECNKAIESITGLKSEEIIGYPFWEIQLRLMPPESDLKPQIEAFREILPEVAITGQSQYFNKPLSMKLLSGKGEYKTVLQSIFPIKTKNGYHLGAIINDITEHTKTEDALTREQYLLNSLILTIPDNIYFKDTKSRFTRINNSLAKWFGFNDPREALGKTDFDIFDEEHARPAFEDEQRIIATGEPIIGIEEKEVWPDGRLSWVSTTKTPLKDRTGKIIGIMGISRDITDHKIAEEKLKHLAAIVESSEDAIIGKTLEGIITSWNKGAEKIYGYSESEMIGNSISQLCLPEKKEEIQNILKRLRSGEYIEKFETVRLRKDGRKIHMSLTISPIRDTEGNIIATSAIGRDITKRKLAEDALRESEVRFRELFENMSSGVAVYEVLDDGKDFIFRDFNRAAERIEKISREQLLGKSILEIFPSVKKFGLFDILQRVWKTGQPEHQSDSLYLDNRITGWRENYVYKLPSGEIVAIYDNITERKQSEEVLKVTLAKYKTLFDCFPLGITISDMAGNIIETNPIAETMLGIPATEQVKRDIDDPKWQIIRPDGTPMPPDEYASVLALKYNRKVENVVMGVIKSDNTVTWINVIAAPLPLEGHGIVITYNDITKRKLAEAAIKASEEQFRTIFNSANDGMYLIDMETRKFIMCNNTCSKMLGYTCEEFLELDISALHPSEDIPFILEQVNLISKGEEKLRGDVRFKRKNGSIFTADLSPTLMTIADKKNILIVFRDITERLLFETKLRSAKEKAEESDRLKTSFLSNMSHEIRTPLNGILGFSNLLAVEDLTPEKKESFYQIISNSSARLLQIINDIIDIAKIEANQLNINMQICNVCSLIENIFESFKLSSLHDNKPQVKLLLELSSKQRNINTTTDPIRLQQILDNLISNAIKYTTEGSVSAGFKITEIHNNKYLQFCIQDTGVGIPDEKKDIIFQRFRQIEENSFHEGFGLGLSISKGLVNLLQGDIWFESKPGKGTTFYFTIPYIPADIPNRKENKDFNHTNFSLEGKTIVIAEDDINSFLYLQELLSSLHVDIIHADNGQSLMHILKNIYPDLILLDINMPVKSGFECLKEIQKMGLQTKIIAQTAYALTEERKRCLESGCQGYISKPTNKTELYQTIKKVLLES